MLEVDEGVGLPEPFTQILAGDDLTRPLEERSKHLGGLILEADPRAVAVQLVAGAIEHELGEPKTTCRRKLVAHGD